MNKKQPIISKKEMVAITDAVSGVMETAEVSIYVKRTNPNNYKKEPFTMFFQAANMAMVREMKPVTAKLLLYLVSLTQYGNKIERDIKDIGEDLGYERTQVWRAFNDLVNMKIVIKERSKNDSRRNDYFLHPLQSWKGKPIDRAKAIQKTIDNQCRLIFPELEKPDMFKKHREQIEEGKKVKALIQNDKI